MPEIPDVLEAASGAYKLILENDRVRVLDVALEPGDKAPMHDHPNDHVVFVMNDATFRLEFPDGTSAEVVLEAGKAMMLDAGPHETTNVGDTTGHNLVVELKK
jgi:quercetin dioxygenase-like cupin family protein